MSAQRISGLTPIAQVLARVAALAPPIAPRAVALADAEGRVLAEDANVTGPWPGTAVALIDGWAVRAEQVADAGPYAPILLDPPPERVDAGAALPRDADAVLPPDAVTGAEVHAAATTGDGVLTRGMDAAPDRPLRRAGARLRALDVAALQAVGVSRVRVREPRVRVVSVGADHAALAVARGVAACGANVIFVRALQRALAEDADAVIAVGGTGAGRNDESAVPSARRASRMPWLRAFAETSALVAGGSSRCYIPAGSMRCSPDFCRRRCLCVGLPARSHRRPQCR